MQSQMKRRSLATEDIEGLELDPNLEEPLKMKARRQDSQDKGFSILLFFFNYIYNIHFVTYI